MWRRGRAGRVSAMVFSVVVCVGGLWWAWRAQAQSDDPADVAGVWSFGLTIVGATTAVWGLWAAVRGLRAQRTAPVIAEELTRLVVRGEGAQYRQMLGSGLAAPDGRIDLAFTVTATGVSGTRPDGTLEGISDYYRALRPGRMVITGTPAVRGDGQPGDDAGTGKTVLVMALILGLTKTRASLDPVPVRLIAASWPGTTIRDWLRTHLTDTYRFAPRDARLLIDANLVLPVIDGLDEMDSDAAPGYTSQAARLLRAIESFEDGGTHCPVVLTCRHAHYQALVDAESEPRVVARLALARVDAARAAGYLRQRVAVTDRARARWQPVLQALDSVAAAGAVDLRPAHAALARTLDTPWRLTLAATVFEERAPDGRYLRDPADMLSLATDGHFYEYLLDCYVGAAVAARHPAADSPRAPGMSGTGNRHRLEADTAWRHLSVLARYLNTNAGTEGGTSRVVAGRTLSSTDLVLHELWPLAGPHRARWIERALVTPLAQALPLTLELLFDFHSNVLTGMCVLLSLALVVIYRPVWPGPYRVDIGRLRTRAGQRTLALGLAVGFLIGLLVSIVIVLLLLNLRSFSEHAQNTLVFTGVFGVGVGLTVGLMIRTEDTAIEPRNLVRGDLVAGFVSVLVSVVICGFISMPVYGLGFRLGYDFLKEHGLGDDAPGFQLTFTLAWMLMIGLMFGLPVGLLAFGLPAMGGSAALRHLAFLLSTRGRLPWRLGRFLDACYEAGILRVAGTAWQFRHRELQDHLGARPVPPHRP
ncbi:hypothetical protein ACFVYR_31865 [Streptomyces sp. NPDC058284]|uniref:hypothetical protein n=1 Tax=unclassified Streptomyces TaxID=2593676 RepID=UPI003659B878